MAGPVFEVGKAFKPRKEYNAQALARAFWRLSDAASHQYPDGMDALGQAVVPKLPAEDPEDYAWRRTMAVSPRHVRSIINLFNSIVCRTPATRETPKEGTPAAQLYTDADGSGCPLPELMRKTLRTAQVEGLCYLMADTNNTEGSQVTVAEKMAEKARPYVVRILPDQVLWWQDWQGKVIRAVILCQDKDGEEFLWHVSETHVQRVEVKRSGGPMGRQLKVTKVGPELPHTYGGCPLVRLLPNLGDDGDNDGTEPGSDSQAAPIAEEQRCIVGLRSLELMEVHRSTYTMHALIGVDPASLMPVKNANGQQVSARQQAGPGRVLCLPQNAAVAKMGSDATQAESIRQSIRDRVQSMLIVAGLSPGNPLQAGQPESGAAKAYKHNETEARLSALADASQDAENLVVSRALEGVGAEPMESPASWPDTFMSPDVDAMVERTIRIVTATIPESIKRAQLKELATDGYGITGEAAKTLDTEIDQSLADAKEKAAASFIPPIAGRTAGT